MQTMNRYVPYIFLAPAIGLLLFFVAVPMGQICYYSFLHYSFFHEHVFAGFDNYRRLFSDSNFWWTLLNSFVYVLVTPVLMALSLLLALTVRRALRGATVFRLVYFIPVVTPIVIVGIIWRWMFAEETGIVNYIFSLVSLPSVKWLSQYPTNIISIMILTVWRGIGYYMMMFLAGLAVIPKEIEEAGRIDGANAYQHTAHILLPMLRPTLTLVFVISSTAAIKMFTELYIMIPGAPIANKTLVALLYRQAFERFDLGYGSAVGMVLFAATLAFSYVNVRLMERAS
jgi:putative chitobiose transport system permease protein